MVIVEDARGARFPLHEFRGTRFFREVRDFVLDTGERVKPIDFNTYVIATTGEQLRRVGPVRFSDQQAGTPLRERTQNQTTSLAVALIQACGGTEWAGARKLLRRVLPNLTTCVCRRDSWYSSNVS